jgi:hypothetical protein
MMKYDITLLCYLDDNFKIIEEINFTRVRFMLNYTEFYISICLH